MQVRDDNMHRSPNRLISEKSPYLLQHAHNPVDWHPWSSSAFERAQREDRPVFLSIGYSTCHWCHVMERESFEDDEVARLMNETFIPVKVDREERPDVDAIYMNVCQMMTGSGGWPLTIIMTPDRRPFFSATYIPKKSGFGRPGMLDLIPRVRTLWTGQRQEIEKLADELTAALRQTADSGREGPAPAELFRTASEDLCRRFDSLHGGFGTAPKFPAPQNILFLLRRWYRTQDPRAREIVEKTLSSMRRGGVWDHVGGGFHRYSTDREWLLPHFEKMLYDQALLCIAYLETFQATGNPVYARTARQILAYVARDMTGPEGGFFCAEDADSEGEEGKFYVWSAAEVREILGSDAAVFSLHFGLRDEGNFREESTGLPTGQNILREHGTIAETAAQAGVEEEEAARIVASGLEKLALAREKRVRPARDDKVLADWNGLMISAFARAARALDDKVYLAAARRAAHFVLSTMRAADGRILHRYRDGEAAIPGHLDDYAFLTAGLLDLYEASADVSLLQAAVELQEDCLRLFWDGDQGGFFMSSGDASDLIVRPKEAHDAAHPSGNSVGLMNLLRLFGMTGSIGFREKADRLVRAFSGQAGLFPSAYAYFLCGLDFSNGPSSEIVIAGLPDSPDTQELLGAVNRTFLPFSVTVFRPDDEEAPPITGLAPFTAGQRRITGRAAAYVCSGSGCRRPVQTAADLLAMLSPEG
ncbi:MAG: thioredoxin domain-containing protein [Thermodesulfovibrionales bacterium]